MCSFSAFVACCVIVCFACLLIFVKHGKLSANKPNDNNRCREYKCKQNRKTQ